MRYLTINDYGVIGNHFSAALINKYGSIDWCCFPNLDSPSHFGSYFDKNQGGKFQITPQGEFRTQQHYLSRSEVLETLFETPDGRGTVTDWMPLVGEGSQTPTLCRKIATIEGSINWALTCNPRFQYGIDPAQAEKHPRGILFRGIHPEDFSILQADFPLELNANNTTATAQFHLETGQSTQVLWSWGHSGLLTEITSHKKLPLPDVLTTLDQWRKIAHRCPPAGCLMGGPWHDLVARSSLILKLLTTSYAGSISNTIAASIKGSSSDSYFWGNRYATLRDGAFILRTFTQLNYIDEAHAFFSWTLEILERDGVENLQPLYTLDGSKNLIEQNIPYSETQENSRQFQLDIFGHMVLTICEYFRIFKKLPESIWPKLVEIADYISQVWRRPDHGPWSYSGRPEHFVASKLFCWVALDQICWLADTLEKPKSHRWEEEKTILHRTICKQGFDENLNSFVRSFGEKEIDASCLWVILLNFLPSDDPRVQGTLHAIQSHSSEGAFICNHGSIDLVASFQFIICLTLSGRNEEAMDRLAEICTFASPLGLLNEIPSNQTNNPPQKFPNTSAHIFLIYSAIRVGIHRTVSYIPKETNKIRIADRTLKLYRENRGIQK